MTTHKGKVIRVVELPSGALSVEIAGKVLRDRSFLWKRDALSWAISHIDAEETQS